MYVVKSATYGTRLETESIYLAKHIFNFFVNQHKSAVLLNVDNKLVGYEVMVVEEYKGRGRT